MVSKEVFDIEWDTLENKELIKFFKTQIAASLYLYSGTDVCVILDAQDHSVKQIDIGGFSQGILKCIYRNKHGMGILEDQYQKHIVYKVGSDRNFSIIATIPVLELQFLNVTKNNKKIRFFRRNDRSIILFDIKQKKITQEFKPSVQDQGSQSYKYMPDSNHYVEITIKDQEIYYGVVKIKFTQQGFYKVNHIRDISLERASQQDCGYYFSYSKCYRGMAILSYLSDITQYSRLFDLKKTYHCRKLDKLDFALCKLKPLSNNMMSTPIISINTDENIIIRNSKNHEEYQLILDYYSLVIDMFHPYDVDQSAVKLLDIEFENDYSSLKDSNDDEENKDKIVGADDCMLNRYLPTFKVGLKANIYQICEGNKLRKLTYAI